MAQTQWAQVEFMAGGEGYGQREEDEDGLHVAWVFSVSCVSRVSSRLQPGARLRFHSTVASEQPAGRGSWLPQDAHWAEGSRGWVAGSAAGLPRVGSGVGSGVPNLVKVGGLCAFPVARALPLPPFPFLRKSGSSCLEATPHWSAARRRG